MENELKLDALSEYFVYLDRNMMRYIDRNQLPRNPKDRILLLLSIKPTWELDELSPFIKDIVPNNIKIANFVMKYARKRQVGSKTIISSR